MSAGNFAITPSPLSICPSVLTPFEDARAALDGFQIASGVWKKRTRLLPVRLSTRKFDAEDGSKTCCPCRVLIERRLCHHATPQGFCRW